MLLKEKVVIVSGIGPGLGIELALLAAKEGAHVSICARTASKLDDAEAAIAELGLDTRVLKVVTDISDRAQCKNLVDKTIEEFDQIDVLINSAFVAGEFKSVESAQLDDWRSTMEVNFFGTMNLTQEVIPHMKQRGGGSIVMVNTMIVRHPMPFQGGYGASKAALNVATAHMAKELGQYGIRINSAFMGWMWGPSTAYYVKHEAKRLGTTAESVRADIAKNIALGDIPEDADCAKAVIFLASDYACAMTGASLDVNGGEYIPG